MQIEIKVLDKEFYFKEKMGGSYYDLPDYQTDGSAAMDLYCTEDMTICPQETKMINTGLAIWIGSNDSYKAVIDDIDVSNNFMSVAAWILPRSSLGNKGLILSNTIGLIDEDYQGELKVSAWNRNEEGVGLPERGVIRLSAGDRIAQIMFIPIVKARWKLVDEFSNKTKRGEGGFGSTNR